jgi:hypothetical protein
MHKSLCFFPNINRVATSHLAVDLTREYSGVSGRPKTAVLRSVDLPQSVENRIDYLGLTDLRFQALKSQIRKVCAQIPRGSCSQPARSCSRQVSSRRCCSTLGFHSTYRSMTDQVLQVTRSVIYRETLGFHNALCFGSLHSVLRRVLALR